MKVYSIFTLFLFCLAKSHALDQSPSLEETKAFILQTIKEHGRNTSVVTGGFGSLTTKRTASMSFENDRCFLKYVSTLSGDHSSYTDTVTVDFLLSDLSLMGAEVREEDTKPFTPTDIAYRVGLSFSVGRVTCTRIKEDNIRRTREVFTPKISEFSIPVDSEKVARKLKNAFNHAAALSGGKKELFLE